MKVLKNARLNEQILEITRKISLIIGLLVLIFLVQLYGKHYGFDQGLTVKDSYYEYLIKENNIKPLLFSADGSRTYVYAAETYISAVFFVVFFLVGKLLEAKSVYKILQTRIIAHLFCFASLIMVIYKLQPYLTKKTKWLEDNMVADNYGILLRETVQTDSFCYDAVIFLLILQTGILLLHYFGKTDDEV